MRAQLPPTFATTIDYRRHPLFAARSRYIPRPRPGGFREALLIIWRVLLAARQEKVLLLSSSWGKIHPELLATALIALWPRAVRPRIVLLGCMWEPNSGPRNLLEKAVLRLADRAICRYVVQSSEELAIFPRLWSVSPDKLRLCLFSLSLTKAEQLVPPTDGGTIFAGGNSMRDYAPLVEAARRMPHLRFIFATDRLKGHTDLPANVQAGHISHHDYIEAMACAHAVIVPIKRGLHRAAGQQTYLNAMWLGKPTIVTDTLGVRDHITDRETGLIVSGSPESYIEALRWLDDPRNEPQVTAMRQAARGVVVEQFSFDQHIRCLLEIMDEMLEPAMEMRQPTS